LMNTDQLQLIKKPEAQVALFKLAQRIGNAPTIQKTIIDEVSKNVETTETFGVKALFVALEECNNISGENIVASFEPEDFDKTKVKATLCHILNEAYEVGSNLHQVCYSSQVTFLFSKFIILKIG